MRSQAKESTSTSLTSEELIGFYLQGIEIMSPYKLLLTSTRTKTLFDAPDDPHSRRNNIKDFFRFCTYMYFVLGEEAAQSVEGEKEKRKARKKAIRQFDRKRKKFLNEMIKKSRTDAWSDHEYQTQRNSDTYNWEQRYQQFKQTHQNYENGTTNIYTQAHADLNDEREVIDKIQTDTSSSKDTDAIEFSKEDYKKERDFYFLGLRQDISKQEQFVLEERLMDEFWYYVELRRNELELNSTGIEEFDAKVLKFLDQMYGDLLNTTNWGQDKYFRLRDKYFGDYKGGYESFLTQKRDERKEELLKDLGPALEQIEEYIKRIEKFIEDVKNGAVSVEQTEELIEVTKKLRQHVEKVRNEIIPEYIPEEAKEFNKKFNNIDLALEKLTDKMKSISYSLEQEDSEKNEWHEEATRIKEKLVDLKKEIDAAKTVVKIFDFGDVADDEINKVTVFNETKMSKLNNNLDELNHKIDDSKEGATTQNSNTSAYQDELKTKKESEIVRRKEEISSFRKKQQGLKQRVLVYPQVIISDKVAVPDFEDKSVSPSVVENVAAYLSGEKTKEAFTEQFDEHFKKELKSVYQTILHLEKNAIGDISERFRDKETRDIYSQKPPTYYKDMIEARKYILAYAEGKGVYTEYSKQYSTEVGERQAALNEVKRRRKVAKDKQVAQELLEKHRQGTDTESLVDHIINNAENGAGTVQFFKEISEGEREKIIDYIVDNKNDKDKEKLDRDALQYIIDDLNKRDASNSDHRLIQMQEILDNKKDVVEPNLNSVEWTENIESILDPDKHWTTQIGTRKRKLQCKEAWKAAGAGCKDVSEEMFYMYIYPEMLNKKAYFWEKGTLRRSFDVVWPVLPESEKPKHKIDTWNKMINQIAKDMKTLDSGLSTSGIKSEISATKSVITTLKETAEANKEEKSEEVQENIDAQLAIDVEKTRVKLDDKMAELSGADSEAYEYWINVQYHQLKRRSNDQSPVEIIRKNKDEYKYKVVATGGGKFFQILREDKSKYSDIKIDTHEGGAAEKLQKEQSLRGSKGLKGSPKFEFQESTFTHNPQAAAGLNYLYGYLQRDIPVLIGVDHTFNKYLKNDGDITSAFTAGYNEQTTDHFVIATGAGTNKDGQRYISFFDPGTRHKGAATKSENKLVETSPNIFTCKSPYVSKGRRKTYTLTMVVPFEKDMHGDLDRFAASNYTYRKGERTDLTKHEGAYSKYDIYIDLLSKREQGYHDELMKDYELCKTKDERQLVQFQETYKNDETRKGRKIEIISTDVYYKGGKFYKVDATKLKPMEIEDGEDLQKLINREVSIEKLTKEEKLTEEGSGEFYSDGNYKYEKVGDYFKLIGKID